jgi:hypothetical protein
LEDKASQDFFVWPASKLIETKKEGIIMKIDIKKGVLAGVLGTVAMTIVATFEPKVVWHSG